MTGEWDARVILTWPQPVNGALRGCLVTVTDADTGQPIRTVTSADLTVRLDAEDVIWADATAFVGPDGGRSRDGELVADAGGKLMTGTFRLLVTEMRVAEPQS